MERKSAAAIRPRLNRPPRYFAIPPICNCRCIIYIADSGSICNSISYNIPLYNWSVALHTQTLSTQTWQDLLQPYLAEPASDFVLAQLQTYLGLLLRWNARINLTAIREPEQIIQRHFGESLFLARQVPRGASTLLDHGSGAGFPGLPIALARPEIAVTLAESHSRKAAFLREAVRALAIDNVTIHGGRSEAIPGAPKFSAVTLRAVDNPAAALEAAAARVADGGTLYWLAGSQDRTNPPNLTGFEPEPETPVPNSTGALLRCRRI